ncbi:MAG: LysM peptidoglycan-binding domain-containing protein [Bacteriovoracaceae bacterium]
MQNKKFSILLLLLLLSAKSFGQDSDLSSDIEDLNLTEPQDAALLEDPKSKIDESGAVTTKADEKTAPEESLNNVSKSTLTDGVELDLSKKEEVDDLESLKDDVGTISFDEKEEKKKVKSSDEILGDDLNKNMKVVNENITIDDAEPIVFDIGKEERELLAVSKFLQNKIPVSEWNEIASKSKVEKYTIVEGDWLWKIAKKFFGSGFFYAKIWSLNPYITNPHEIKPGMVLTFDTGSADNLPNLKLGEFNESFAETKSPLKLEVYGNEAKPDWLDEKKRLQEQGVYVQYASDATYEDLETASTQSANREYEKYEPPTAKLALGAEAQSQYDDSGFDKDSKIQFRYKEGFSINTFVTTNIVQDFGEVTHGQKGGMLFSINDYIYVKFDKSVNVMPGELYSIYEGMGKMKHPSSERTGYKYGISGSIKTVRKVDDKWECIVQDSVSGIQRKDRITVYTPKIPRITKTFNARNIEAAIIGGYSPIQTMYGLGNIVYLDRGRADGVEMGNVFEVYDFKDRLTKKNITKNPTYKIGEITVITLTDNFATGLVTNSIWEFRPGYVSITKSPEDALRATKMHDKNANSKVDSLKDKAIDELDVELNLNDLNEDLLEKADKVQLTEDELEELERQEREKSILKESERDLKSLERLEKEIESAESQINESKLDEDKLLENQSLDSIEKNSKAKDGVESLNEIEEEFGKKFLDEEVNNKENPYGLTEFDIEEVDELLNTDKKPQSSKQKKTETIE